MEQRPAIILKDLSRRTCETISAIAVRVRRRLGTETDHDQRRQLNECFDRCFDELCHRLRALLDRRAKRMSESAKRRPVLPSLRSLHDTARWTPGGAVRLVYSQEQASRAAPNGTERNAVLRTPN